MVANNILINYSLKKMGSFFNSQINDFAIEFIKNEKIEKLCYCEEKEEQLMEIEFEQNPQNIPNVASLIKASLNQFFLVHNKEAMQTMINIFKFNQIDE